MSERMQWSEAEAVVRAYQAEQRLRAATDPAPMRRFSDRSGLISAALAAVAASAAIAWAGPSLLHRHPVVAALKPHPTRIEAPLAPSEPVLARVFIRTSDRKGGIVHLRSLLHHEEM